MLAKLPKTPRATEMKAGFADKHVRVRRRGEGSQEPAGLE